jgi:plastocyanin
VRRSRAPQDRGASGAALLAAAAALALTASNPTAAKTYKITIANLTFGPAPSGLRVGDTLEWVNQDIVRHSATAKDRSFDVDLPPHARASTHLRRAGVVSFYCRFHPGMTGKLTIGK